ncbi:V-set and transmembrane domain-containing protein 2-like protein isoform X2 [Misgurnus anguillicaudatus]|uniref:V-set and transmembrane domain-containing protein 2-like protein isoform X2 n=1 Tax=Misgurnus anguillicaudatus TaxID=75329 RepID=UPI003CCF186B
MLWILHCVGLCVQITAHLDNRASGNTALFTEVPRDIISQAGEDVELACSFKGSGSSSVSLEIQWWYARHGRDLPEKPGWTDNQVLSQEVTSKGETKISVVKVVGSNISHKLRLSSIKPSDGGTYECRVIDFSESRTQQHRVQAYLQVRPDDLRHKRTQLRHMDHLSHQHTVKGNHQLDDGEPGDAYVHKGHHKSEEMFYKVDHHGGNKTKAVNKHQSESRDFQTHDMQMNSDCPDEDCTL